jgi:hypothetical protein
MTPAIPMGRPPRALWLLTWTALSLGVPGQAAQRVADDEPLFTVHTAGGHSSGPLRKIGADWSVRLGGPSPVLVKGEEVITLRRQGAALPPLPVGEQVILATGDRLGLDAQAPLRLSDEVLHARPRAPLLAPGGELKVPLSRIAVLWLAPAAGDNEPAGQLRRLLTGPHPSDQVLLRSGDAIDANVLEIDRQSGCRIQVGGKKLLVPLDRLMAVAFNSELQVRALPRGPFGHLVVANGARLGVLSATVQGERLEGKTLFGARVAVPLGEVAALDLRQGRAVYLSDLPAAEFTSNLFLGLSWPLTRDRNVAGGGLVLGGSTFDKGLGMHAESRVSFDLAGKYDWFEATVGLDGRTGRRGRVKIDVLLDGKRPEEVPSKALTRLDGPRTIRLEVRGVRRLTLAVLPAQQGDVQAHVNWADARLIKSQP